MRRPFATVGFTLFSVLLALFLAESTTLAYCALFGFSFIFVISLFNKNLRQAMTVPVCLFTAVVACLLFIGANSQKQHTQNCIGDKVKVEATVYEAPYMKDRNGRHYCILKLGRIDGKRVKGRLRLSFLPSQDELNPDDLRIGDSISFTGKTYIPGAKEKSISRYFTGETVYLGSYSAGNVTITEAEHRGIGYHFHRMRAFVARTLRHSFSDRIAGLLVGILTGDKSCLDNSLYDSFRKTGIAHLMAVSGLHLSIWVFSLGSLIPEDRKTARLKYSILIIAVVFIMLLAGLSESVKRAGFMSMVYLFGKMHRRRNDSLNSLGFAVLVMIIINPACVLSVSLQLSFLATLGILTLGKLYLKASEEFFSGSASVGTAKLAKYCFDIFLISISVLVFTLPVLIYNFGGISTVSAWVNILISPVVTPMLILSGVSVMLSPFSFASYPLNLCIKTAAEYVIFVTERFSNLRNAFLTLETENILLFITAAVIILCLSLVLLKRNLSAAKLVSVTVSLSLCLIFLHETNMTGRVKLHLARYGECVAVAIEKEGCAVMLCELPAYEKELFVSALEKKGAEICYIIERENEMLLKNNHDGRYILKSSSIGLFGCVMLTADSNSLIIEGVENYVRIFYGEALHYDDRCDIMISVTEDDVAVKTANRSLYLEQGCELTLVTDKEKIKLRGEDSWLNSTKNKLKRI